MNDYWRFPTRSDSIPNSRNGSATDPNSANCYFDDGISNGYNGGFAVSNSTTFPLTNVLTEVGAFSLAGSFYGTFDQAGSVWEWIDGVISGNYRVWLGGSWAISDWHFMRSDYSNADLPQTGSNSVGFRIVMNPDLAPPVLNFSRSGNTLTFSWFGNFKLQFQNNSLSSTGWEDYPAGGSSPVIHNINPAIPAAFFRLSTP